MSQNGVSFGPKSDSVLDPKLTQNAVCAKTPKSALLDFWAGPAKRGPKSESLFDPKSPFCRRICEKLLDYKLSSPGTSFGPKTVHFSTPSHMSQIHTDFSKIGPCFWTKKVKSWSKSGQIRHPDPILDPKSDSLLGSILGST